MPTPVGNEEEYVLDAMRSGQLAGDGKYTALCHTWLERSLRCEAALLTQSGTAALEMAAVLCGIMPGDEIIMPSFTFVSTANAFVLRGAVPVFVDIDAHTLNLDPDLVEAAVTSKTKAIVPVHYGGLACDMEALNAIAARHTLFVIEDAAHAMLSKWGDKHLGTIGHVGCLSFHETKNVIAGEGGALLINDTALVDRARIIWQKGTNRSDFNAGKVERYTWVDQGSSYLPSELTAAYLFGQLEQAENIIARRVEVCERYSNALSCLQARGQAELPLLNSDNSNGHLVYLILEDEDIRDAYIEHMRSAGIMCAFHYVPLHNSQGGSRFARFSGDLPSTNSISKRLVRLPLFYGLTNDQIDQITNHTIAFFK